MTCSRPCQTLRLPRWTLALAGVAALAAASAAEPPAPAPAAVQPGPGTSLQGASISAPAQPQAPPPERLLRDLPVAPPAAPVATGAATPPAASPAPADPATVARELGAAPEAAEPLAAGIPPNAPEVARDQAGPGRKHPVTGVFSIGLGSHDTYQVSLGLATMLGPNVSLRAGVAAGRWWYDDWGCWRDDSDR